MDATTDRIEAEGLFRFWRNLILVFAFFTLTPLALGLSLFSLFALPRAQESYNRLVTSPNLLQMPKSGVKVYASLPGSGPSVLAYATTAVARPEIVKQYLERYDSPLIPHAQYMVDTADKYGLDYRLIAAIAQQESNLCKKIPPGGFNCWGWGIHSEGTLGFRSFEEGIETVSQGLKENYFDKGYITVETIMSKYTPSSNGSWAKGVSSFMEEMQ
jgi:hypothetical protein